MISISNIDRVVRTDINTGRKGTNETAVTQGSRVRIPRRIHAEFRLIVRNS
jgi:hypothetical protein